MADGAGVKAEENFFLALAELAKQAGRIDERIAGCVTHRELMLHSTAERKEFGGRMDQLETRMVAAITGAVTQLKAAHDLERREHEADRSATIDAAVTRALNAHRDAEKAVREDIDNKAKDAVREVRTWLMIKGGIWGAVILIGAGGIATAIYLGLAG